MAWSKGNKKWTVPFQSLGGVDCHVDIYQRGYTGSTVSTLTGAANPFEYAEDDDEDLLNGVVRSRSGYIRIRENNYGDLDALYPSTNTDHYVEFYYGQTLDFTGFMQAQEFDNAWEDGKRVIEFPVISPLGLAVGTYFDYTALNPPSWRQIRNVITTSLGLLDADYQGFYFPVYLTSQQSLDMVQTDFHLNSLTFCPFSNAYNKMENDLDGIYAPKTVLDALTMICTGLGLILHDAPGHPVFQRVDYDEDYCLWDITQGRSRFEAGSTDLTDIATVASNRNKQSRVMPLSKIHVKYDGAEDVPEMSFDKCRGFARGCAIDDREFCTNLPVTGGPQDFDGTLEYALGINSDGLITAGKVGLCAYGGGSLSEMIMYRPAENNGWGTGHKVCTYTIYEWNGESGRLHFKHQYGDSIENLDNPDDSGTYGVIAVVVKSGNYYYNLSTGWQLIPSTLTYTRSFPDGRVDCEVDIGGIYVGNPQPLVIEFYAADGNTSDWIHTISEVNLLKYQTASDAYLRRNENKNEFTIEGDPSDQEGDVSCGFSIYCKTLNRLRYTGDVSGAAQNEMVNREPRYPYLLTAQDRLQIDMRMSYLSPATLYVHNMAVWESSVNWRVIARSFQPWNDVHRLTLHHSTVFD